MPHPDALPTRYSSNALLPTPASPRNTSTRLGPARTLATNSSNAAHSSRRPSSDDMRSTLSLQPWSLPGGTGLNDFGPGAGDGRSAGVPGYRRLGTAGSRSTRLSEVRGSRLVVAEGAETQHQHPGEDQEEAGAVGCVDRFIDE